MKMARRLAPLVFLFCSTAAAQTHQGGLTGTIFDITTQGLKLYRMRQAYTPDRWGFLAGVLAVHASVRAGWR
jgi:hypothetical protein